MIARRLALLAAAALCFATAAKAESCLEEAGKDESRTYVDQCLEVSPATRPPCNAENSCEMIIDEIVRGCEFLKADAPEFCSDYSG